MKYKLYVAITFNNFIKKFEYDSVEKLERKMDELENSEYNYYLIVRHDIKTHTDIDSEFGQIRHEINKRLIKTI